MRDLLTRAQNPFDVPDDVLARLESAVLSQVEPHGRWQYRTSPGSRCTGHRHVFLLADGGCTVLWELRYDDGGGRLLHEVYDSAAALAASARRLRHRVEDDGRPGPVAGHHRPLGAAEAGFGWWPGDRRTGDVRDGVPPGGPGPAQGGDGAQDGAAAELASDLRRAATSTPPARRLSLPPDSPDHARRLLRRAENPDPPGEEVRRLLATALAHEILPVPRPRALAREWQVWCSLYEHAFLLPDGSQLSLYELEHNLSGSGQLICEVYADEDVADQAAHRHARDRGIEL